MHKPEFWDRVGKAAYKVFTDEFADAGEMPTWEKMQSEHKDKFIKAIQAGVKQIVLEGKLACKS